MPPVTRRRQKGKAREDLVVAAASEVIAERGLANVRIADIAERAGMTPGHVTYYFRSKTELLMRAIRQSEEEFTDQLERQITAIRDPWRRLARFFELATASGIGDPGWLLWFEVWSNAALEPDVAHVMDELDTRARSILADTIRYGRDRGAFRADDPDTVAVLLSAVIDGLSIQLALGGGGLDRKRTLELCMIAAHTHLDDTTGRPW
jgi:AcrR family transcriptional regulator